jgi:dephospho-CoA kinase
VVIGIAGGIGSGKSAVARSLAERGCLVYDADAEVSRLYERREVIDRLRSWWGADVAADGVTIDRARVAQIIFEDSSQRARLEGLLFPLLAGAREDLKRQAARAGALAVILDAPLLFEAGLDAECDAVIFVDTPRDERLRRLRARSGWDAGELDRRERAQLPLDAKRARSGYTLAGDGSRDELRRRVNVLLDDILRDLAEA